MARTSTGGALGRAREEEGTGSTRAWGCDRAGAGPGQPGHVHGRDCGVAPGAGHAHAGGPWRVQVRAGRLLLALEWGPTPAVPAAAHTCGPWTGPGLRLVSLQKLPENRARPLRPLGSSSVVFWHESIQLLSMTQKVLVSHTARAESQGCTWEVALKELVSGLLGR